MNLSAAHKLDARSAELIARQLNSAYMNASGFGVDHPTTERALDTFHASLSQALQNDEALSLILDRGSLFVEKHPVGARFNPRRMVDTLNEAGLESITFQRGFTSADARALITTLDRLSDYPSLAAAEAELEARQSGSIRFNYIVYRKVTSDQKVVASGEAGSEPGETAASATAGLPEAFAGERVLDQLDSFLSLGGMAENPDTAADWIGSSLSEDQDNRSRLVAHLKRLVREIETGGGEIDGLSPDELFSAMSALRQRLQQTVSTQEDVDRIMAADDEVISEVDELTYSTLVSLVREEYRSGSFSVQRMAQIINRMLPDASDLKRLLPRLRHGLLEEGMPLAQYTRLVHELSKELRGEHLVRALESGAEHVGMEVDDIVKQIQQDPAEAARLLVLAAELRQGGAGDKQQLSAAFTDYIERVSRQLALGQGSPDQAINPDSVGSQLERVQKELIQQLGQSGLAPEAAKQLEEQLQQRRPQPSNSFDKPAQTQAPRRQSSATASGHQTRDGQTSMPASVLSVSNTALFLKHQARAAQRYGNPFSVLKVLVEWLVPADGSAPRRPRNSDMAEILPELYFRITRLARDLDLIGSLEKTQRAVPFIILPMTEEAGARVFRQRLLDVLLQFPFHLDRGQHTLACTVTIASFDTETDRDANAFVQRLNQIQQTSRADNAGQAQSQVTPRSTLG